LYLGGGESGAHQEGDGARSSSGYGRSIPSERVSGAEREFDRMREELGKAFPDPNVRVDTLNKFEQLFS
jgi:hypothetical protein